MATPVGKKRKVEGMLAIYVHYSALPVLILQKLGLLW